MAREGRIREVDERRDRCGKSEQRRPASPQATDQPEEDEEQVTGSGWLATFADLMSLLMCFFVLMLSFSEMDVLKYKQVAGSMREAFGVQNEVKVKDIPKGTSIIAQEFSPGTPRATPLNEIWQKTTDESRNSLDVACQDMGSSNSGESGDAEQMVVVDKIQDLVGETEPRSHTPMLMSTCMSVKAAPSLCAPVYDSVSRLPLQGGETGETVSGWTVRRGETS